jgi:hypothetical protein
MIDLHTLARSAMLGCGNTGSLPDCELFQLPKTEPESSLLAAAAAVGTAEIGGWLPLDISPQSDPCPPEKRPYLPAPAADYLKRILSGEFETTLPEFLGLAAQRGYLAPPEILPALLGLGKNDLRPLVLALAGQRGVWLAKYNPSWAYALPAAREEDWETGKLEERFNLLEALRRENPGKALQLLQSRWGLEAGDGRALLMRVLAINLSPADEPFLENCLDDKRKEVRDFALNLLVRLPASRLVERNLGRLEALIQFKSKMLFKDSLDVNLPEKLDPGAKRDGISGAVMRKSMGEKANWLAQMLSATPPACWSQKWKRSPDKLLGLALSSEWKEPLLLGWLLAAERSGDAEWAAALAEFTLRQSEARKVLADYDWGTMACLIPLEKLEGFAKSFITPLFNELDDKHPLLGLLEKVERPWSAALARPVLSSLQRQAKSYNFRLMRALPLFALHVPVELAEEFSQGWPESTAGWDAYIQSFIATMRFRKEMREAL